MNEPPRCPKCNFQLPPDAPAGLCPKCLVLAGFESQPPGSSFNPEPTQLSPASARFQPPSLKELAEKFPKLEVLELLGKGGMGAVYKARQPGLDRLVAVKILPVEISGDPDFVERFQREARALAKLSHPHIVAVYDYGQIGDLCYIIMEFVNGANLRQAVRTKALAPDEALAIVPQICEALQFAHDEGVVHRDIKPENILIDKRGRVKIADFGLAKLIGLDAIDHSLTAAHQVMGTLQYMAPEQMKGTKGVDHRADIYSLGVVFYELLTGELPMGRFAPPSTKVQIDVRLDEVVLRALEQDPEQRYQHASDVKSDVDNITSQRAVPVTPRSPLVPSTNVANELAKPFPGEPRFSRFAIAGAVWAIFGLLAVIPVLFFIGLNRVWNGEALPTDLIHSEPPLVFTIFMGALLAIGAGAPIGTTIYGAIAIGHIKHSGGKIIGLPLGVADAIFFPLLLLGGIIAFPSALVFSALAPHPNAATLASSAALGTIVASIVCFFVGRAVWRAIAGGLNVVEIGTSLKQ